MRKKFFLSWILAALLWSLPAEAADFSDLGKIITESQQHRIRPNHYRMVWWLAPHYWDVVLKNLEADEREAALGILEPHTIVAIIDADLSTSGVFTFTQYRELADALSMQIDRKGEWILPLEEEAQPDEVRVFLANLKSYLAGQFGRLGEGFQFFLFPNRNLHGEPLLSLRSNQWLTLKLDDDSFIWRLPPDSLFPSRTDKETGETFPGNYHFNPYTGKALEAAP
jgi:hypothetical protein